MSSLNNIDASNQGPVNIAGRPRPTYTRVSNAQRQNLIQILDSDDTILIKDAAARVGIKYPRATFLYRQHRLSVQAQQNASVPR